MKGSNDLKKGIATTNYWNEQVDYGSRSSAQSYMNSRGERNTGSACSCQACCGGGCSRN